ncbi:MAG: aromatic amino acid lyase, partial [Flavobacteriales bacterium]
MNIIELGPDIYLKPEDLVPVLKGNVKVKLTDEAQIAISAGRDFMERFMNQSSSPVYGINTGFGALCNVEVSDDQLAELQTNLVRSHACGMGDEVEPSLVRMMMVLKIQGLSYGNSGVRLSTVNQLVDMVNADILPLVYESGSLGASGDLAPLAHIALAMMGEGRIRKGSKLMDAAEALSLNGLKPLILSAKEGLALLNGTQFMSAFLTAGVIHAARLSYQADLLAAYSLEAFDGRVEAFDEAVHKVRPHQGQLLTAKRIREFVADSPRMHRAKKHVQDP